MDVTVILPVGDVMTEEEFEFIGRPHELIGIMVGTKIEELKLK